MHKPFPHRHVWLMAGLLALTGCYYDYTDDRLSAKTGYRPVYASYEEVRQIQTLTPQPLKAPGKIYIKDKFLFINEIDKGIHVVDNSDPAKPVRISFIAIRGNRDIAVKDSILYADNAVDLVALNIANPRNVRVVKRVENSFPYPAYPPQTNVTFECADPAKGVVIGWEQAELVNPKCFR
ncbi:hypothetical protein [Arsenicibacter rosenii]|uniref:LVIVD repeat-containing protein n=1 Tax=Arsenicibacter rosenii TaxID=1750698 RepID=A0A1S2VLC5_9BACT|nr:hypothetical protein [Arsenicibacter rosenii]OIN59553.1 hypothetical protein BLX24_06665 [Arsenicibacter rosenii]